jgi:hypothetical protein
VPAAIPHPPASLPPPPFLYVTLSHTAYASTVTNYQGLLPPPLPIPMEALFW